jgi:hypothetical protein
MPVSKVAPSKVSPSKADDRHRKSAQAQMYAPRVRVAVAPPAVEDIRLRRLATQALEALKLPGAIPSRVIFDALVQAKALGA